MSNMEKNGLSENETMEKKMAGVCGLFCPSCSLYIGTKEEPRRLEILAAKFKMDVKEMMCEGCRSDRVSFYCRSCHFKKCASDKGIEFCGSCEEYPCQRLTEFQGEAPHRAELWESQEIIKDKGFENWFRERKEYHSCAGCGEINSIYDSSCRKCGNTPSSPFFENHREEIISFLAPDKKG